MYGLVNIRRVRGNRKTDPALQPGPTAGDFTNSPLLKNYLSAAGAF